MSVSNIVKNVQVIKIQSSYFHFNLFSDLFPTSHRATAISTVSAFARIGSLVSPFAALFDPMTTLVIYGVCLLASAVISSFIYPDTTKTKMPRSLAESEILAKSKFPYLSWYRWFNKPSSLTSLSIIFTCLLSNWLENGSWKHHWRKPCSSW